MSVERLVPRQSAEESLLYAALVAQADAMCPYESMLVVRQPCVSARGRGFRPDLLVIKTSALFVELDDPSHYGGQRYVADRTRDYLLEDCGVPVLRVPLEETFRAELLDPWVLRIVMRVQRARAA